MKMPNQFTRQSFLGPDSDELLANLRLGIVGYGGGGSHLGQQLAHLGVGHLTVIDPDTIEDSNLNRLVGGTWFDVLVDRPKVEIAARTVGGIHPRGALVPIRASWHDATEQLRGCHAIFGAVDTFGERIALERFSRRYMMPYIDVGMDVIARPTGFSILGQAILSTPGGPCLRCMGLIDDEQLAAEEKARQYGAAGGKPQVVWPNGVLASTAVGLLMQLVTPWHPNSKAWVHLEYDGETNTLRHAPRLEAILNRQMPCRHYNPSEVGDALFGR